MYHVKAKFMEDALVSNWKVSKYFKRIIKGQKVQVYNSCLIILCEVRILFSSNDILKIILFLYDGWTIWFFISRKQHLHDTHFTLMSLDASNKKFI